MKRKTLVLSLFVVLVCANLFPQQVDQHLAKTISENFILYHQKSHEVQDIHSLESDFRVLAWIVTLSPEGFLLVSGDEKLRPVLAYSFQNNLDTSDENKRIFETIIEADIESRLAYPLKDLNQQLQLHEEWKGLISASKTKMRFEQWPPSGTTPTGGWLFENWTQGSPYNQMCPIDGNTNQRSIAGCPATAMAMIVNCLYEMNGTRLDDTDDYYHSFGAGNQFWIDNDWQQFGFPYFDSLNLYLDTIEMNYLSHKPLENIHKAALTFSCGVALKEVFSSSISGTWGIEQAADAFQRFGFLESRLVYDSDTSLQADLAENIKNGWPAQLGLVDPPPTTVGHNVVVDGYNTDEYYHFNFGWGGNSNGWYTMPPTNIPYNLTVIEGIVMDIMGSNPHVGIDQTADASSNTVKMTWVDVLNAVIISQDNDEQINGLLSVYGIDGRLAERRLVTVDRGCEIICTLEVYPKGIYLVHLTDGKKLNEVLKINR
jgi:hypothetical protein